MSPNACPSAVATHPPILIVEDEPDVRAVVAAVLADEGYPVTTAADGAQALAVVERQRPALIVLDMRMPVLDGWGFARALRERGIRLPILVMTAAQNASAWAQEVGAVGYLPKPFDLMELVAAVERVRGAA